MVHIPPVSARAAEVRVNTRVRGTYLVRRKHRGVGKTGKPWLQLILGDKTGSIDARVWDNADSIDQAVQENDVVDVEGQGVAFMDGVQLKVSKVTLAPGPANTLDYLPEGAVSDATLRQRLIAHRDALAESWPRALLGAYLDDEPWLKRFLRAPAAKSVHHAYIGGLAEHTLSMMDLSRSIGNHYVGAGVQPLNVDVLVVAAFLHDTGKVDELTVDGGFGYTDAGRLLGHIHQGAARLNDVVRKLEGFPPDLHLHLQHLILSHHGEYEYGSPRRPKTLEAQILHFIDNMDARVAIFFQAIRDSAQHEGNWTGLEPSLGRHIYRRPIDTGHSANER